MNLGIFFGKKICLFLTDFLNIFCSFENCLIRYLYIFSLAYLMNVLRGFFYVKKGLFAKRHFLLSFEFITSL